MILPRLPLRHCLFVLTCLSGLSSTFLPVKAAEIQRATDAPQPLSPHESASKIRLPEGFRLELVACEPLIQEPSCIAFDEYGRMFVTELHGYNIEGELDVAELNKTGELDTQVRRLRWEFMGGKVAERAKQLQFGKLKLLSDSDGDGQMDKAEIWADDLPPAYGVIPARGGVIVVAAPDIVFLKDNDGNGKPDERETLFTGFHKREMERGINNPRRGPDNWIYVGAGGHGGTITGPHLKEPVELHHSDFRIKADGSAIEPVTGRVGTFGLAMNDVGDRFPCSGGQPAIYALPLDYKLLTRNPWVATPSMNYSAADYGNGFRISQPHPWRVRRQEDPAWIKFYGTRETDSNYFTGGCGGEIYNASLFADSYRGDFYYCEPSLNIIHRCELIRDGAGYKARRAREEETSEFLASEDQWFRPMNLRVGPDGALYIVDMYREIIEDYSAIPRFLQQQYGLDRGRDKGRIWRLLPNASNNTTSQTRSFTYVKLAPGSENRIGARQLRDLLESDNLWQRLAAQRLIFESNVQFEFDVPNLLGDVVMQSQSSTAVIHALHALSRSGQLSEEHFAKALRHDDWRVRTHGLKLMAERDPIDSLNDLLSELVRDSDPGVRLQVPFACRDDDMLLRLVRRHGLDRWMDAAVLSSVKHPGNMLARLLEADKAITPGEAKLIRPLAATIAGSRDRESMVRTLNLLSLDVPTVATEYLDGLLSGLSHGGNNLTLDDKHLSVLADMLQSSSAEELRFLANRVAGRLANPEGELSKLVFSQASKIATSNSQNLAAREKALLVLREAPFTVLADLSNELLDTRNPLAIQQAAVATIGANDNELVPQLLLAKWNSHTPSVRKSILDAMFGRRDRLPAILDAIESEKILSSDLTAAQQEQLTSHEDESFASRAKQLLHGEADEVAQQRLAQYIAELENGTPKLTNGQRLFENICLNCHQLGGRGSAVGPALGALLNKPDDAIVADILDPSSKIDSEYTSYTIVSRRGTTVTGVLASESPTSVTLKLDKGVTRTVLRNEIELLKASEVSLMPSNLHEQISPVQMVDLLGFMRKAYAANAE